MHVREQRVPGGHAGVPQRQVHPRGPGGCEEVRGGVLWHLCVLSFLCFCEPFSGLALFTLWRLLTGFVLLVYGIA